MATATSSITTTWVGPDAVTGLSGTSVEEFSYIQLNWDISTQADVDFERYTIYRRVAGSGDADWAIVGTVTDKYTLEYLDITTGQGVSYEYYITQWKAVPGDASLESSASATVTAALESDIWFVLAAGTTDHSDPNYNFELPVAEEQHTRPIQQEVFEPIVNNRKKIARGNVLGYEGSLTLRWASADRETAKAQLALLTETQGPHVLKSPFGDVWQVEFDAPDYVYSGGGNLQVQMGWVEVS